MRQKLEHYQKELGVGVVLTGCQTGTATHELTHRSMELLAKQVLPYTRGTKDNDYRRTETLVPKRG